MSKQGRLAGIEADQYACDGPACGGCQRSTLRKKGLTLRVAADPALMQVNVPARYCSLSTGWQDGGATRITRSLDSNCSPAELSCRLAVIVGVSIMLEINDRIPDASVGCRAVLCAAVATITSLLGIVDTAAQEAEPRAYSNTPVGLNFLIAGYLYSEGKLAFDPNLSIADAKFHANTGLVAYVRSFDFAGQSAKFDVIVPASSFAAVGSVKGQQREREMAGLGDPRFRVSVNLLGAPALSVKNFAGYRQDLIVGVSLQVSAPLGQYDNGKLLNLGNNRWSFRPELGISKAWGPWTLEVAPSVTIFSDNTDFFGGNVFAQAPIYALQAHLVHTFQSGAWMALDGIYFAGGHTTLNGIRSDNEQRNTRAGVTLAVPIDRNNSLKFSASTGITTRTGSNFSAAGIAWQYRWGEGY